MKKITLLFVIASIAKILQGQIEYSTSQTVTSRNFLDNVVIKSGAIVEFNGNFKVAAGKKISVQMNAILIVKNSTITNLNEAKWDGIRLFGNLDCKANNLSHVTVDNSSISGAMVAIRNVYDSYITDINDGGGVRIYQSNFFNNYTDVEIYRSRYDRCNYVRGIYESNFEYDRKWFDKYNKYPSNPKKFSSVYIEDSKLGFLVVGNTFFQNPINGISEKDVMQYKGAINIQTSPILVKNNTFEQCNFSIIVLTAKTPQTEFTSIQSNIFKNNTHTGIVCQESMVEITYNQFIEDTKITEQGMSFIDGIKIEGLFAGRIHSNTFNTSIPPNQSLHPIHGIWAYHMGTGFNQIEACTFNGFKGFSSCIRTNGDMRGNSGGISSGLKVFCCDFRNTDNINNSSLKNGNIRVNDGQVSEFFNSTSLDPSGKIVELPAGNLFSRSKGSVIKIHNEFRPIINYYYGTQPEHFPDNVIVSNRLRRFQDRNCEAVRLKMAPVDIEVYEPKSKWEILSLNISPCDRRWIGDPKILTVNSRISISNHIDWIEGLIAGSKSKLTLLNLNPVLNVDEIQEQRAILSGLGQEHHTGLDMLANDLTQRESLGFETVIQNDIISLFDKMNSPTGEFRKAEYFGSKGNFNQSAIIMANIESKFNDLSDYEKTEFQGLKKVYQVLSSVASEGRNFSYLTSSEKNLLQEVLNSEDMIKAKQKANTIIEECEYRSNLHQSFAIASPEIQVTLYPIPADQYLSLNYTLPENQLGYSFKINNIFGTEIYSDNLTIGTNTTNINTSSFNSGNYILYILNSANERIYSKQFNISH
jgi:hypothetical protein